MFGDGAVDGAIVLVHGVLGGVGSLAAQLARWGGATVVGTVRRTVEAALVPSTTADHLVALDGADPAGRIRAVSPGGVDRIVEVAFSENIDLDAAVVAAGGTIAAYGTRQDRPGLPFWPLLFDNVTIRLLGSDDFPAAARQKAAADLTRAAAEGRLHIPVGTPLPLDRVAEAHERVDAGTRSRVLLAVTGSTR